MYQIAKTKKRTVDWVHSYRCKQDIDVYNMH